MLTRDLADHARQRQRWQSMLEVLLSPGGAGLARLLRLTPSGPEILAEAGDPVCARVPADGSDEELSTASAPEAGAPAVRTGPSGAAGLRDSAAGPAAERLRTEAEAAAGALRLFIPGPDQRRFGLLELYPRPGQSLPATTLHLAAVLRDAVQDQLVLSQQSLREAPALPRTRPAAGSDSPAGPELPEYEGFFVHDELGRFLDISDQACRNHGYSRDELMALRATDLTADLPERTLALYRDTPPGHSSALCVDALRKDGSTFPAELLLSCHRLGGQKVFLCLLRDLSVRLARRRRLERAKAELERRADERTRALDETTRQLQAIMDTLPDGITLTDPAGRLVQANPAAMQMLKLTAEHFGTALSEDAAAALATGTARTVKELHPGDDGSLRTLLITHSPRRDAGGRIDGLVSLYRDITAAEAAERQLQLSLESLERAEKLARIGSWTLNLSDGSFSSSAMMYELNGKSPDETVTVHDLANMLSDADFTRLGMAIQRCISEGTPYMVDVTHFTPQGGSFAAEIRGHAIRDPDGRITAVTGTVQDVSERVALQERLSAIADSLPNGAIYRIDFLSPGLGREASVSRQTMKFSYISAGIQKLIGLSAEELAASPEKLIRAIHPEDVGHFLKASRRASEYGRNFEFDFRLIRPDGRTIWLQVRSAPQMVDGRLVWDGIILDVTDTYETAEALRRAKEAAEAAERAKSGFLAMMSHEIRTPLNSVIGMTRLTLQTDLSPRQRNYLEKIDTSARALLLLINDILDFSRIEAGALTLESIPFALGPVLETVSNATSLRAEEKGLDVVYAVEADVPSLVQGDPLRLGQVLINLVGNAIKFTDRGAVTVGIRRSPGGDGLRFDVRDTGIGIDPAQQATLFRPFSQSDARTARFYGGSGLGLSISKQLVQLMGGEISVDSQPGIGSCFAFTVPLTALQPGQIRASACTSQTRHVLIVDDSSTARSALSGMLSGLGFSCRTAASGQEAMEQLHAAASAGKPVDLVLLDWQMPELDGLETARLIRTDRSLSPPPAVVIVTAHTRGDLLRAVEQLPLQGVLIKPVTESVLLDTIQQVFHQPGAPDGAPSSAPSALPPGLSGRSVLVVDDNLFNLEVASDFLMLAGMRVETAVSGPQALEVLSQRRVDVVLMDMQMPGMDGIETTRQIRRMPGLADLPVIALTAQARTEDRDATVSAGLAGHLTKPIDEAVMYRTLASILGETSPTATAPEPSAGTSPGAVDIAQMLARMRGNHERVQRTLDMFLRDFSACPEETRRALAEGDRPALAAVAHRIRGTAGYLGATELQQLGNALELQLLETAGPLPGELVQDFVLALDQVLDDCRRLLAS